MLERLGSLDALLGDELDFVGEPQRSARPYSVGELIGRARAVEGPATGVCGAGPEMGELRTLGVFNDGEGLYPGGGEFQPCS